MTDPVILLSEEELGDVRRILWDMRASPHKELVARLHADHHYLQGQLTELRRLLKVAEATLTFIADFDVEDASEQWQCISRAKETLSQLPSDL